MTVFTPDSAEDMANIIKDAAAEQRVLRIRGGGSKDAIGRPNRPGDVLCTSKLGDIIDYDPAELVLTAGAGTPLAEIEALLADYQQMLAFDPFDHGPLFGIPSGSATLGGILAGGVSGPRRLSAGAARDHFLGFKAVSGRGEIFVAGGRVVKNVTGYDLPKLLAGSWGQLAALVEVTVKVLPKPQAERTILFHDLDDATAIRVMAKAMGSAANAAAAAHLPAAVNNGRALTLVRLEGFAPALAARRDMLLRDVNRKADEVAAEDSATLWDRIRLVSPLQNSRKLWRIITPTSRAAQITAALKDQDIRYYYDWAGGLIWLGGNMGASTVRALAEQCGGHAMVIRGNGGDEPIRHPEPAAVAGLGQRIKAMFDPSNILDPERFQGNG